ncbi:protein kinase domain-containing protein [Thermasporomyces composti]|uniref:non-specific serine/threonine protein kinase n=1 Tax=Thermasporomyces composti TaxID=696763 RepID=A0A3D9V0D2_THECX|nr:protein kinase [Thermasporomyces composti]REF34939.1 serine/threonine protein kinase [Thermasporomyces composti]
MRGDLRVPGYELGPLRDTGVGSETWHARSAVTGEEVLLKRLRLRADRTHDDVRRLLALLDSIGHPHLVRVRQMVPLGADVVLVLDRADGGSLDELLSGRGALDPGEVVTALAPVAEALAAVHEHGLVHGDVTPEAIVFTAEGRPLLADVGILGLVEGGDAPPSHGYADPATGGQPTPASDVYALAAVGHAALTGLQPRLGQPRMPLAEAAADLPSAMVHAVTVGLQPLPARRPDAAMFAELLYSACPPSPVRFPIGLVLGDADLAAMLGRTDDASSASDRADGSGGTHAGSADGSHRVEASTSAGHDAPPFREFTGVAAAIPAGAVDGADEDEDDTSRLRPVLLAGGGVALLLGGALAGGLAWAHLTPPTAPTVAQLDTGTRTRTSPPAGPAATATPTLVLMPPSTSATTPTATAESSPTAEPVPADPSETADPQARWRHVLTELDSRRARAFAESDPSLLASVYVSESDLLAADRTEIDKCVRAGCRVEGLRFEIKELDVASETDDKVVLVVTDQLQAYTIVSPSGVRTPQPAGPWTTRRITLVREPAAGWLIARIEAA